MTKTPFFVRVALAGLLVLASVAAWNQAPGQAPAVAEPAVVAPAKSGADLYEQTLPSLALIATDDGHGTGWVLDREQRILVTNFHVVASGGMTPAENVRVVFPVFKGEELVAEAGFYQENLDKLAVKGEVIHSDPARDLAFIQVESLPANAKALPLSAKGARPGEHVFTIGNPGASDGAWVYNEGAVRQLVHAEFDYDGGQHVTARVVETQNPLNPGDSGGPLVNAAGELVAINAAGRKDGALVSSCIDVRELRAYLKEIQTVLYPKKAQDFIARAESHTAAKRYEKAVGDYSAALKREPRNLVALVGRAAVYNKQEDFDKAVADADAALRIDRDNLGALKQRAGAHLSQEDFDRALADLNRILDAAGDDVEARFQRGQAFESMGEIEKALDDYVAAAVDAPEDGDLKGRVEAKVKDLGARLTPAVAMDDDGK